MPKASYCPLQIGCFCQSCHRGFHAAVSHVWAGLTWVSGEVRVKEETGKLSVWPLSHGEAGLTGNDPNIGGLSRKCWEILKTQYNTILPTRMNEMEETDNINQGTLIHCWWEYKLAQPLWKIVHLHLLTSANTHLWPSNSFLKGYT